MNDYSKSDFHNHLFRGRRRLGKPHGNKIEGIHVPVTLWQCQCNRKYRGDKALHSHMERARHSVASSVRN